MAHRVEIHPGDGGADAQTFATELATALARHTGSTVRVEGRIAVVECP